MTALALKPLSGRDELYTAATDLILSHLKHELETHGTASLLLSGGSTPGPVYQSLSRAKLPWENVNVGLVDERWVDETDPGSNAALIRRTLLQNHARTAKFKPMKTQHGTPQDGQDTAEALYTDLVTDNSLAVIGMGTDGHICSWFPHSAGLDAAVDLENTHMVQAIKARKSAATGDYLDRLTLTLSALKRCKKILLLTSGDEKRSVIEQAFESVNNDLPLSYLLRAGTELQDNNSFTILHAN